MSSADAPNEKESRSLPRRRLFQDDESPEIDYVPNTVTETIQQSNEEAKQKWNFDFEKEEPLEGDWEWERVGEPDNKLVPTEK